MRKHARLFALLILTAASCTESPPARTETDASVVSEVCGVVVGEPPLGQGEVVAAGDDAPCTIEFREVIRLQSRSDGISARVPATTGPGGTYVTATYQPGRVAVWSPEGELIRVMGNGDGEGPGEFWQAASMVVGADSVVNILPGLPHWHRYEWAGEFIETIRAPAIGGLGEARIGPDGLLVATTQGPEGARLVLWSPGEEVRIVDGFFNTNGFGYGWISASPRTGLWSAVHSRYTIRRHALPSGSVDFEVHRRVDWFRSSGPKFDESAPVVFGLNVDDRGLLWVWTNVPDPDAPSAPRPRSSYSPDDADRDVVAGRYRDYVLEVLSRDGEVIASRRYDRPQDVALGATADLWVRTEADVLRSLTIVEPILVRR